MRTTIATLCVLGLLVGCERRSDQANGADLDRSGSDTTTSTAVVADTATSPALDWRPAPPGLPAGARAAVLEGDPGKPGPFTIRVDMPKGYEVRPHHHPTSERIRVLTGDLMLGHGTQWDGDHLKPLAVGSETDLAAREPHFVRAKEQSLIEIRSDGPFEITYENPTDDPRNAPIK